MSYVEYEAVIAAILKAIVVCRVSWWKLTPISEERSASIFRVKE
jgi:hypothetical protein